MVDPLLNLVIEILILILISLRLDGVAEAADTEMVMAFVSLKKL